MPFFGKVLMLSVRISMRRMGFGVALSMLTASCGLLYDFGGYGRGRSDAPGSGGTASTSASSTSSSTAASTSSDSSSSSGPDASSPVSLQDCVLLMHMDESRWEGAGAVTDSSGQGNHGSPQGTAATTSDGKFGRAASLDGMGYITVPDAASLHPTHALTVSAWIYPTGLGDGVVDLYPGIVAKRVAFQDSVVFTLFVWTGNNVYVDIDSDRLSAPGPVIENGRWYHLAVVYDSSSPNVLPSVTIYIDGALAVMQLADTILESYEEDLTIGYLPQGAMLDPKGYLIGRLDEVAIWSRALSRDEIMSLAMATGPL